MKNKIQLDATYYFSNKWTVGPDTHPSCLHFTSNQQQLENQTAYVVTNAIVVSS